ncbi:MAG: UDP-N-acetylmuramoyl-L-alanyl-D-glutamate--2,6-diaminopimelate ligase [Bacillota bacterium]
MNLKEIIQVIDPEQIYGNTDIEIADIVYDSRKASDNSLFICIEGFENDGHDYINNAVNNGTVAVLIEKDLNEYRNDITYVKVNDSRKKMSKMAALFYGYPLRKLQLIGITGTNGKTTTSYLIKSIIENAGFKTGLIGTINIIIGEERLPATRTTPESLDLYKYFSRMVKKGVTHVVMEVSSHALELERVKGMDFTIAVFTNISQDHLDFHNSLEAYLKAKSKLFQQVKENGYGIINIDDDKSDYIIKNTRGNVLTYSIENKSDIQARKIKLDIKGVHFKTDYIKNINIKLTGRFNVYNALAGITTGKALGLSKDNIKTGLEEMEGVPGRFELIDENQNFGVIVDYAHTPDGMENVLQTAREITNNNIIIVFGCGGDRDKGKRPLMGKIGIKYGDYCILTSDNPRSEDPIDILKQIEAGINSQNKDLYEVIPDRKKAIFRAIEIAQKDDFVIIIGKGHETYQIFKNKTIHFDDREVAREAISCL